MTPRIDANLSSQIAVAIEQIAALRVDVQRLDARLVSVDRVNAIDDRLKAVEADRSSNAKMFFAAIVGLISSIAVHFLLKP